MANLGAPISPATPRAAVAERLEGYLASYIYLRTTVEQFQNQPYDEEAADKISSLFFKTVPPLALYRMLPSEIDTVNSGDANLYVSLKSRLVDQCKHLNQRCIEKASSIGSRLNRPLKHHLHDSRPPIQATLQELRLFLEEQLPWFYYLPADELGSAKTVSDENKVLADVFLSRGEELKISHYIPDAKFWSSAKKFEWLLRQVQRDCSFKHIEYNEHYPLGSLIAEIENKNFIALFNKLSEQLPSSLARPQLSGDSTEDSETIQKWIEEHKEDVLKVTELDLRNTLVTTLPEKISLFTNLRKLTLGRMTFLPSDLNLPNLEELAIHDGKMEFWPENPDMLPKLKSLNIQNSNPIDTASLEKRGVRVTTFLSPSDYQAIQDAANYLLLSQ